MTGYECRAASNRNSQRTAGLTKATVSIISHLHCQTVLVQDTELLPTHLLQITVLRLGATAAVNFLQGMSVGLMVRETIHFLEAQQLDVLGHDRGAARAEV